MKRIELDAGIEEFSIAGGGVLRFNPCDPNLYARFLEAEQALQELEKKLSRQAESGEDLLQLTVQADREVKDLLNRVFGCGNDFHAALGGVNLLAVTADGRRVSQTLFAALEEILTEGAARFAGEKAAALREGK